VAADGRWLDSIAWVIQMRCTAKRRLARHSVLLSHESSQAISLLSNPDAAKSAILDHNTSRAGVERPLTQRSSIMLSLPDSLIAGAALVTNRDS
jgi:hypothetical protein